MGKRFKDWRAMRKRGRVAKQVSIRLEKEAKKDAERQSISTGGSIRTKRRYGGAVDSVVPIKPKPKPKKERGYGQAQEGRGGYSKGGSVASRLSKAGPVAKPN